MQRWASWATFFLACVFTLGSAGAGRDIFRNIKKTDRRKIVKTALSYSGTHPANHTAEGWLPSGAVRVSGVPNFWQSKSSEKLEFYYYDAKKNTYHIVPATSIRTAIAAELGSPFLIGVTP